MAEVWVNEEDSPLYLEEFRNQVSKAGFRVTQIGRDVTFRWTGPSGAHLEVTAVVNRIYDSTVVRCLSCGERADHFYEVKATHQLCDGSKAESTEPWCYDCYCPK